MANEFYLWEGIGKDHVLLRNAYSKDNYRVIDTPSQTGRCLICFTGNGLFYPNTLGTFKKVIIERDRFEWANLVRDDKIQEYYQRIVLVRDIYKQWYVTGINNTYNTTDKLVNKLNELIIVQGKRMNITTVGNSAGGYAAVLYGILLGADRIFNFSGQYDLNDEIYRGAKLVAPFLELYRKDAGKYYDLKPYLKESKETTKVFYFFPYRCDWDKREFESVAGISCIKPFFFKSRNHGTTVWGGQEIDILISKEEKLLRLTNDSSHLYSQFSFARKFHTFGWCVKRELKYIRKIIKSSLTAIIKRLIS